MGPPCGSICIHVGRLLGDHSLGAFFLVTVLQAAWGARRAKAPLIYIYTCHKKGLWFVKPPSHKFVNSLKRQQFSMLKHFQEKGEYRFQKKDTD